MNPLFQMMGANSQYKDLAGLAQQFMKFKSSFQGNPQQMIQEMLNSGKISQSQYDAAVQQAKELQKMLGM